MIKVKERCQTTISSVNSIFMLSPFQVERQKNLYKRANQFIKICLLFDAIPVEATYDNMSPHNLPKVYDITDHFLSSLLTKQIVDDDGYYDDDDY